MTKKAQSPQGVPYNAVLELRGTLFVLPVPTSEKNVGITEPLLHLRAARHLTFRLV